MQPFSTPEEDLRTREACHLQSMGRPVEFSAATLAELEETFTHYPSRKAAVLPALWMAQRDFGWISTEVIELVSRLCQVPPSHVYSVVSFYTMYNRSPKGKYNLQLCTNISCQLRGAEHILDCLREKLGIELGETTSDRLFTLEEVECLAACEMAPVIQVNDEFLGPLTVDSARDLVDRLGKDTSAAAPSASGQTSTPAASGERPWPDGGESSKLHTRPLPGGEGSAGSQAPSRPGNRPAPANSDRSSPESPERRP